MRPALGGGLAPNNLVEYCSTSKTPITVSTVSNCDFLREFMQESNIGVQSATQWCAQRCLNAKSKLFRAI